MLSMEEVERDAFSTQDEFSRFEQIAYPINVLNLIALIIAIIFCIILFRIV